MSLPLEAYIKFGTKLFHLTWEEKVKCKTCHEKNDKKVNLGILKMSLYVSNGVPQSCLDPNAT
jgi:hypothetical protein